MPARAAAGGEPGGAADSDAGNAAHNRADLRPLQAEAILAKMPGRVSTTAIASEIRRRTGKARVEVERCPHCGGEVRRRIR